MLINRKTRPVCNGGMGKGNNRCNRVTARVLAENLLGAIKSKANCDVTSRRLPSAIVASTVSVHKTPDKSAGKKKKLEMATVIIVTEICKAPTLRLKAVPVRASCGYQFWHRLGDRTALEKCIYLYDDKQEQLKTQALSSHSLRLV